MDVGSLPEMREERPVQRQKMGKEINYQRVSQACNRVNGIFRNLLDSDLISDEQMPQKKTLESSPLEAMSVDNAINDDGEALRTDRSSIAEPSQMSLDSEADYGVLLQQYWQQGKHDEILSLLRQ